MDLCYVLHADHAERLTFSARVTIATLSDMYSRSPAPWTLKGPLHGGPTKA